MTAGLGEFGRIARYFAPLAREFPGSLGLGDDGAVFGVPAGCELVVTTDALVEGVHFLPDDPPADIAAKALRVNLSDLAAMGADPLAYSLVTSLPKNRGDDWVAAFAAGLAADQDRFRFPLLGGDSVSTPGPVTLVVSALGTLPEGKAVRRNGGRAGDRVLVTGSFGDGALGLVVLRGGLDGLAPEDRDALVSRYRRPEPRLRLVDTLRRFAHAGLDVSDGLVADLGHLCRESGVAATVEQARLPLSPAARAALALRPDLSLLPLVGGDDYELVFSCRPDAVAAVVAAGGEAGISVTEIGWLREGEAGDVDVRDASGRTVSLEARGWAHF